MRAVIQRVKRCEVRVSKETVGKIGDGLLVLLAVHKNDEEGFIKKMADKIIGLRIFDDGDGKMNLSIRDAGGEVMVVSQFTLYGDVRSGNRPGFSLAASPAKAEKFYQDFVTYLQKQLPKVETGRFGAMMDVDLVNNGPVTIIIDL